MSEKGSNDDFHASSPRAATAPQVARLCYVDDSKTSAYVVRRVLEPYGYQVDHFTSAEPAFVALVQEDYDLLLTDLKVSSQGMDGDDLIRTVRQSGHPKISDLPIIVITGTTAPEILLTLYDAGANQVMNKPVDGEELDGHIRRLLHVSKPRPSPAPAADATVIPIDTAKRATSSKEAEAITPAATPPQREKDIPVLHAVDSGVEQTETSHAPQGPLEAAAEVPEAEPAIDTGEAEVSSAPEPPVTATVEPIPEATYASASQADFEEDEDFEDEVVIIEPEENSHRRRRASSHASQHVDANILYEMEKYSLVQRRRRGLFGTDGIVSGLVSVFQTGGVRRVFLTMAFLAVIGGAGVVGWQAFFDKGLPVQTTKVAAGEIYQSLTAPGRVVSKHRLDVNPSLAGRLVKILVKEGDKVEAGQVLAQLDERELLSRLKRAKAGLTDAREGIALAERTLERLRKANSKGAVARRFVEDAEVELRAARAKAGVAVEDVHGLTLELEDYTITAPFAGTVTAHSAEVGQWVTPDDVLFTLVDESQREIEVWVDAADSLSIEVGQQVVISSDASPDQKWQEAVVRLGTATDGERNSNSVKIYVSLGGGAPELRIGQQVDADIRTAWNSNALTVPFAALVNPNGRPMVAVIDAGRVRLKPVSLGIEDFTRAEITQGLNEGDEVILMRGQNLQEGDKVYPAFPNS
jgi:RND family efflux transporter MFP subunit